MCNFQSNQKSKESNQFGFLPKINQITGNLVQTFFRCMEPPYRIRRSKEMLREHMQGYVPALFLLQNTLKLQFSMYKTRPTILVHSGVDLSHKILNE